MLFLFAGLFVMACLGCEHSACRSVSQNSELMVVESVRAVGLDRPTMLHMRNNVPGNYYTPYR